MAKLQKFKLNLNFKNLVLRKMDFEQEDVGNVGIYIYFEFFHGVQKWYSFKGTQKNSEREVKF